ETVRPVDVARGDCGTSGFGIEPIDVGWEFRGRHVSLVVAEDAERRGAGPDRILRFYDNVVGGGERLALQTFPQHSDGAIVFGARDPPRIVLAGDKASLAIAGVTVGIVGRLSEDADRSRLLLPAHDTVVGDVAPKEVATVAKPHRALGPSHARGEPFDACQSQPILREARIERLHCRIGVAVVHSPLSRYALGECSRGHSRATGCQDGTTCELHAFLPWLGTASHCRPGGFAIFP